MNKIKIVTLGMLKFFSRLNSKLLHTFYMQISNMFKHYFEVHMFLSNADNIVCKVRLLKIKFIAVVMHNGGQYIDFNIIQYLMHLL